MTNMQHWNAMCRPPEGALKRIKGGRLNGMTDISPQWRYKVMTEHFGPVGIGWRFTVDKTWTENGADEVCAFAMVSLYIKHDGEWSEAIPGNGGSKLVAKESAGPHTSDECYKMAITDGLSTAMKTLGVAADIYCGFWDGSKYITPGPQEPVPQAAPAEAIDNHSRNQACELLVAKQEALSKDQQEWCEHQIAAGEYAMVIDQLIGM